MSTQATKQVVNQEERRRSQRLLLDVTVIVRGESTQREQFEEMTFTISASAHGALVVSATSVSLGQKLTLQNQQTLDEIEGRVARLGAAHGGLTQVGIEFARPAPQFWSVTSPPASWNR